MGLTGLRGARLDPIFKLIRVADLTDMAPQRIDLVFDCLAYVHDNIGIFAAPQVKLLDLVWLQPAANLLVELERIPGSGINGVDSREAHRSVIRVVDKFVIDKKS